MRVHVPNENTPGNHHPKCQYGLGRQKLRFPILIRFSKLLTQGRIGLGFQISHLRARQRSPNSLFSGLIFACYLDFLRVSPSTSFPIHPSIHPSSHFSDLLFQGVEIRARFEGFKSETFESEVDGIFPVFHSSYLSWREKNIGLYDYQTFSNNFYLRYASKSIV